MLFSESHDNQIPPRLLVSYSKFLFHLSSYFVIHFFHPEAQALVEFGDTLKQMADVKYALDDNVKQNFLEPLHQLQMKDLKEVMVRISRIISSIFKNF